ATAWAAIAAHQRRSSQRQQQLFEIWLGNALPLRDFGSGHRPLALPARDLGQRLRGISGPLWKAPGWPAIVPVSLEHGRKAPRETRLVVSAVFLGAVCWTEIRPKRRISKRRSLSLPHGAGGRPKRGQDQCSDRRVRGRTARRGLADPGR